MAAETTRKAEEEAKEQNQRNLLISILDTLPRGPSDRDALAEKAMVAYLLNYASRDYATVAGYAYEMADAMIAERLKRPTGQS
jgi:predicted component of type VI protein secretion system